MPAPRLRFPLLLLLWAGPASADASLPGQRLEPPAGTMRGVVVDAEGGRPLGGVKIDRCQRARASPPWNHEWRFPCEAILEWTVTDAAGRFALFGAPPAPGQAEWLIVTALGYEDRQYDSARGRGDLRIALHRGAELAGTLLDAHRRPVAGARYGYRRLDGDGAPGSTACCTGADGRFYFGDQGVAPGTIEVFALDAAGARRVASQRITIVKGASMVDVSLDAGRFGR